MRVLAGDVAGDRGGGVGRAVVHQPGTPFYTGRPVLLVNGEAGYSSFASKLPEADGVFLDTRELLWAGPRRVFLVVRRSPAQSVVAALPPAGVRALGRYGSRWLYANR